MEQLTEMGQRAVQHHGLKDGEELFEKDVETFDEAGNKVTEKETWLRFTCEQHGIQETRYNPLFPFLRTCEKCILEANEMRSQTYQDDFDKQERETERIRAEAKNKEMNLMKEFWNCSFDACTPQTQKQKRALEFLKAMASKRRGTIVLLGDNGIGKTHFAVSALKEMGGKYYTMYKLGALLRSTYNQASKKTELDVLEELANLPCLVIDEIGRTKGSEAEMNFLSEIINDRRSNYMPTILLSNKTLAEHCANFGKCEQCQSKACFDSFVGKDVMSRLQERSAVLELDGTDRRNHKNTKED